MENNVVALPPTFIERLKALLSPTQLSAVLVAFSQAKPPTFRVNTLKSNRVAVAVALKELGIETENVDWYNDAFILKNIPQKILTASPIYNQGLIYVQSLSSMLPALVLSPNPGEQVLDLTAAPGSKTTQMAAIMHNQGQIVANDKSRIRLYKLAANLKIQGVTNTVVTNLIGQTLWRKYPEHFDKALVDVPCSMEGRFYTGYPKSYREWSPKKIKILSQIQRFLLRSAISATKVDGTIVYSTCTLSPEENEEVVDWVLHKETGAVETLAIDLAFPGKLSGLTSWQNQEYDPQLKKTVRILPSPTMEGFYIAKLKKTKSTV